MNACTIVALLGFLAAAGLLIQNLSLKKKHAGYKTIQEAIRQESTKLTILQGEQKTVQDLAVMYAASAREEEANVAAAVGQRSENQAAIEKLKTIIADLDKSAERARSELATARSQGVSVKAELEVHHEHRSDLATIIANLNKEKLTIAARVTHLLSLEARESTLRAELEGLETNIRNAQSKSQNACDEMNAQLVDTEHKVERAKKQLNSLIGQLDLYSRLDGYTRVGHFEMPNYLYDTTVRYQSEIKEVRERQRKLIREKSAVTYPSDLMLCMSKSMDKKVLDGQVQLMLSAFNVECDLLIEKVGPANLDRTLEQIEKRAEALEKCCATLKCGFNTDYVELKFEECKLQFEFALKRKEEQDEQRVIREQMREEVRVQKQYEEAVKDAEREEAKLSRLLERARAHLAEESGEERSLSLAKIDLLEEQLREAQKRGIRAKSMAEQTRRGYVYVISNLGAFGERIFKIGLTRRLDPQERIDELSSASVPFSFDVHAMCYSEDAPALEHALHKRFSSHRVNAVNFRKEFFRVDLNEIQAAIEEMVDDNVDFTVTAKADDYFQSKRLLAL
jgi:hypothetical protein